MKTKTQFNFLSKLEENWTSKNWQSLFELFDEQHSDLPTGGFHNPTLHERIHEGTEHEVIIFKCHYDNFENEDDCWFWSLNRDLIFEIY